MEIIDPNTGKLVPDGEVGELRSRPCAATGCPSCATELAILPGSSPATVPAAASTAASTVSWPPDDMIIVKGVNIIHAGRACSAAFPKWVRTMSSSLSATASRTP